MGDPHLVEEEGEEVVVLVLVAAVVVEVEKRGEPLATTEGSSLRNNTECSPRYNSLISTIVSSTSPLKSVFLVTVLKLNRCDLLRKPMG